MEWRCEWCGKPHEEDDPPCDNCGHGSFERAVVRRTDLGDGPGADTTTVWECTECGREHPKNAPPCSRCNNPTLERQQKRVDESNLTERPGSSATGTVEADTTTVWVCTECGREHPKNAPPCSRCNNPTLERQQKQIADSELTAPGYRELLTPRYVAAFGVVLALVCVFALGTTGIVDVPGFPDDSVPEVDGVPGNETTAAGVSLAAVEQGYLDAVADRRADEGVGTLDRRSRLDEIARYYNQRRVKSAAGAGGATDIDLGAVLPGDCSEFGVRTLSGPLGDGNPGETGARLVAAIGEDDPQLFGELSLTGVDAHGVGDTLYLTQAFCTT